MSVCGHPRGYVRVIPGEPSIGSYFYCNQCQRQIQEHEIGELNPTDATAARAKEETFSDRAAKRMAQEIVNLVHLRIIGSRSPAADAAMDYFDTDEIPAPTVERVLDRSSLHERLAALVAEWRTSAGWIKGWDRYADGYIAASGDRASELSALLAEEGRKA